MSFTKKAHVLLSWDLREASFLSAAPGKIVCSPVYTTPDGDQWIFFLATRGLLSGHRCSCLLGFKSGGVRKTVAKFSLSVVTPKVMFLCNRDDETRLEGKAQVAFDVAGGISLGGGVGGDRVTVVVNMWMTPDGVPRPLQLNMQSTSACRLTPMKFITICDFNDDHLTVSGPLQSELGLAKYTTDNHLWGLWVHLGKQFEGVESVRGTFTVAPPGGVGTKTSRSVMHHRWSGGWAFQVPPFFTVEQHCIACELQTFNGGDMVTVAPRHQYV